MNFYEVINKEGVVLGRLSAELEDKALRLARENPKLTVRELRALVGCRRDIAMQALREVREASGKDPS